MARRFGWLWAALILLTGIAYQWLVHSAFAGEQSGFIRITLALLPLLALAGWVAFRARNKRLWVFVLVAAGLAIYALERHAGWGLAAAYGLPHAVIYLSLLWFFGQTLWRGNEPLVTRLARRVHGTLPAELTAYTRRVTIAWCVFFTAQIAASALLFMLAPLDIWSLFVNVLNIPLLLLMFIGEYGYRLIRHRDFPQASFFDGIRAFANDAAPPASAKAR